MAGLLVASIFVLITIGGFFGIRRFSKWITEECKKNVVAYHVLEILSAEKETMKYSHEGSGYFNWRKFRADARQTERNIVDKYAHMSFIEFLKSGNLNSMFSDRQLAKVQFSELTGIESMSDDLVINSLKEIKKLETAENKTAKNKLNNPTQEERGFSYTNNDFVEANPMKKLFGEKN